MYVADTALFAATAPKLLPDKVMASLPVVTKPLVGLSPVIAGAAYESVVDA